MWQQIKQKNALVHYSSIISEMIKYLIVFYSLSCTFSELNYLIIAEFYVVNGHNRLMITYFKDIISKNKFRLGWDNLSTKSTCLIHVYECRLGKLLVLIMISSMQFVKHFTTRSKIYYRFGHFARWKCQTFKHWFTKLPETLTFPGRSLHVIGPVNT